ncbi:MAG TPA: protein translocase subunit SecD [Solirubrobacteraceae bacterium]|jgi:SecD/SecF fusion protein|nr:protein translocase subunit SecD [Solirubrobacteraceae bacterium]
MSDRRRNGLILLLVLGLLIASGIVIATQPTKEGLDLKGGVQLVYQGKPTPQQPHVTQDALNRAVDIIRERVDQLGVSEPEIQRAGSDQIEVGLPDVKNAQRAIQQVGKVAQLYFYDWEANVLGADGKPHPADPKVTGGPSAGSLGMPEYQALMIAAKRPPMNGHNATTGVQWYLVNDNTQRVLRGPEEARGDLSSERGQPPGTRVVRVNPGTILVRAQSASTKGPKPNRWYALNDNPSLKGTDITNPEQNFSNGTGGEPDVTFSFTDSGAGKWHKVTREIAQRGQASAPPTPCQTPDCREFSNHFAASLDNELITVPYISYQTNPDGITGSDSEISGSFTIQSAQDLANLLKTGALPIKLQLISQSQVSATLGKQALHQGLIAGIVGLAVVILFLLAYYRLLGVVATVGLAIYGVYFYALIKLIPITLTLPGIAGLILTIGVAADANIVIFERVKEEIRAGRSIPSGIATGYKKGLSAIIDANVVTVMTAFILFILATAGVKGFAFTLGIGTIVSLFTAVLATQAILGTVGRSRVMQSRVALGAGEQRFRWRFDFMGASRWFFSLSGAILLIGALAIGGKGLNFGIDFRSGTRIETQLVRPANENQVRAIMAGAGYGDAKIQRLDNKELGRNAFQIETATLKPDQVQSVRDKLAQRFGIGKSFSNQSIGPTFGQTVANSAVIAIIASLLVISAYIALRFEWKYAVPVLIALLHDLLITSGVYSLTGREVTTSTVAALLTILGYSLYDTIIVFDRVRENVPRMPRAAFKQIVNRSMSEVLTRSLATSFCTLLPIIALLLFGGETLTDFAFALLVGVLSGAYSSIFIASPVLWHWKEREPVYARRTARIMSENGGVVPAYAMATTGGGPVDIEPDAKPRRGLRRERVTTPDEPAEITPEEFDDLVADLPAEDGGKGPAAAKRAPRPEPEPEPDAEHEPEPEPERDEAADEVDEAAQAAVAGRREPGIMGPGGKKRPKQRRPRNRRHGRNR